MVTLILVIILFIFLGIKNAKNFNKVLSIVYPTLLCAVFFMALNNGIIQSMMKNGHIIKKETKIIKNLRLIDDNYFAIFDIYDENSQNLIIRRLSDDNVLDKYIYDTIPFDKVKILNTARSINSEKYIRTTYRKKAKSMKAFYILNEKKIYENDKVIVYLPPYNIKIE